MTSNDTGPSSHHENMCLYSDNSPRTWRPTSETFRFMSASEIMHSLFSINEGHPLDNDVADEIHFLFINIITVIIDICNQLNIFIININTFLTISNFV